MAKSLSKSCQSNFLKGICKVVLLLFVITSFANARPYRSKHYRSKRLLRNTLRIMKLNINDALIEYITTSMNCTSVHECCTQTVGMSLTYLPKFTAIEDVENWNQVFRENLHSLRTFDFYVKEFVKVSEGTSLSQIAEDHLTDVGNLLHQFLIHFKSHMESRNCYDMAPGTSQTPLCINCVQSHLPSLALEVTRNYLFLFQFHDFLNNFHRLYSDFFTYDTKMISNC